MDVESVLGAFSIPHGEAAVRTTLRDIVRKINIRSHCIDAEAEHAPRGYTREGLSEMLI
jgi:hypothetical protein